MMLLQHQQHSNVDLVVVVPAPLLRRAATPVEAVDLPCAAGRAPRLPRPLPRNLELDEKTVKLLHQEALAHLRSSLTKAASVTQQMVRSCRKRISIILRLHHYYTSQS